MAVQLTTNNSFLVITGLYADPAYVNVGQMTPIKSGDYFSVYDNVLNKEYRLGLYSAVLDSNGQAFASASALGTYLSGLTDVSNTAVGGSVITDVNYDAGNRTRISQTSILGDYKQIAFLDSLLFTRAGTGASAFSASKETITCDAGEYYIIQSKEFHHYFSGKSQQVEITAIDMSCTGDEVKRFGYFSSSIAAPHTANFDGFFLENAGGTIRIKIYNDGTLIASLDPTTGAGADWFNSIDLANFNVHFFDFLWLGGAILRYFVVNGGFKYVTGYSHANVAASLFMKSPNQPLRIELRTTTNAATLTYVCAQVSTEGIDSPDVGKVFAFTTGDAGLTLATAGTEYLVLAIRQPVAYRHVSAFLDSIDLASRSNNQVRFRIALNPTLVNVLEAQWAEVTNTTLEYVVGNGTDETGSGGTLIGAKSTNTNLAANSAKNSFLNRINHTITGVSDVIAVLAVPAANNAIVDVAINMRVL